MNSRGNSQEFTNKVITLWYRPPELLLGETKYGTSVDIWSAGCILAELILGKPLFTGKTEMDQLKLIFEMIGTPTVETWSGYEDLKLFRTGEVTIETSKKPKLRNKYQYKMPAPALKLIEKLLELDPKKRLTANRAINSRFFLAEPRAPTRPEDLGTLEGHFHERQTKKIRKEAKAVGEKSRQTALEGGCTEKEAQEAFDETYRRIVAKIACVGLKVAPDPATATNGKRRTDHAKVEKKRGEKEKRKDSHREKHLDRKDDGRKRERSEKRRRKR